jgi:ABC-type multidrug transport system fused ATPase/permease subunit
MARYRYRYNPEQLKFEQVPFTWKDYARIGSVWLLVIGSVAFGSIYVFTRFVESPRERAQQRELEFLQAQVEVMNKELNRIEKVVDEIALRDDDIYRNIFGAEPFPQHLRRPGIGGSDRMKDLRGYSNSEAVIETKSRISTLQRKLVAQSKSFEELFELAKNKEEMLASIPAIQPIRNDDLTRVASGYGYRIHPIYKVRKLHTGMDFTAPEGTEIFATGDGVVVQVETLTNGYGRHVVIQHGFGYETLYAHMSQILVKKGQKIKRGEVIGLVGNTGTSVGAHLHYEVIQNGTKVNPAYFYFNDLTPEQFERLLEQASRSNQSFD